ncbi:hypothetical protein AB0B79_26410 [Streptomyces sp. NPDC039022]|uniref:hypothetical protein n=1 Tax=Streptomyces sp. NPDC039022 TaxID=3157091 RepID=UPI0033E9A3EF
MGKISKIIDSITGDKAAELKFALGAVEKLTDAKIHQYVERSERISTDPFGPVKVRAHPIDHKHKSFAQFKQDVSKELQSALDNILNLSEERFKKAAGEVLTVAARTFLGSGGGGVSEDISSCLTVFGEESIIRLDVQLWKYNFEYKGMADKAENAMAYCSTASLVYPEEVRVELLYLMVNQMISSMKFKDENEKEAKREELKKKLKDAHEKGQGAGSRTVALTDVNKDLKQPCSLAVDVFGALYVADCATKTVWRKKLNGDFDRVAGGGTRHDDELDDARQAAFKSVTDIVVGGVGDLFILDRAAGRVCLVRPSGKLTTVADAAKLAGSKTRAVPSRLGLDKSENLYVSAFRGESEVEIWHVRPGEVKPHVLQKGKTEEAAAADNFPYLLVINPRDSKETRVRRMTARGELESVVAGGGSETADGKLAIEAKLGAPYDLDTDSRGNIYISDNADSERRVRKVSPDGYISTVVAKRDQFTPAEIAVNAQGGALYVLNSAKNWAVEAYQIR